MPIRNLHWLDLKTQSLKLSSSSSYSSYTLFLQKSFHSCTNTITDTTHHTTTELCCVGASQFGLMESGFSKEKKKKKKDILILLILCVLLCGGGNINVDLLEGYVVRKCIYVCIYILCVCIWD